MIKDKKYSPRFSTKEALRVALIDISNDKSILNTHSHLITMNPKSFKEFINVEPISQVYSLPKKRMGSSVVEPEECGWKEIYLSIRPSESKISIWKCIVSSSEIRLVYDKKILIWMIISVGNKMNVPVFIGKIKNTEELRTLTCRVCTSQNEISEILLSNSTLIKNTA